MSDGGFVIDGFSHYRFVEREAFEYLKGTEWVLIPGVVCQMIPVVKIPAGTMSEL